MNPRLTPDSQMELGFGGSAPCPPTAAEPPAPDGLNAWRDQRNRAARQAATDLGLPIGREVEVWLRGSVRLRGKLRLNESILVVEDRGAWKLELAIDNVVFKPDEVESCVRLD